MSDLFSRLFTVSELTSQIRLQLEAGFPLVWVSGEISNVRCPSSGHRYFTLKDEESQIRAVMFRSQADRVNFTLEDGLEIIACGRLSVYAPRGDYQLLLDIVEPKGLGERHLAFLQLKAKFEEEGLFDPRRKKLLPPYPQKIGIVTSVSGAAIHDLLTILQRRWPFAHLVILPVAVQGPEAIPQLTDSIRVLNSMGGVEIIIVGRGGGSIEDLWAFNEEPVVRAIADSQIPVVSAVGHETDITLSDWAADCRAPTPSAAAELAVPDWKLVSQRVRQYQNQLARVMGATVTQHQLRLHRLEQRIPEIRLVIRRHSQRVDDLEGQLLDDFMQWHRNIQWKVLDWQGVIREHNPGAVIIRWKDRLEGNCTIQNAIWQYFKERRNHVQALGLQLHQLSPLKVLGRGTVLFNGAMIKKF
ncbi:MAG: exodeoxyribonuclease VII large subunit [Nitrospirales bacterium]|nr:exodeoxyribonuclease VII large subunit [Nitrospirales bacterium]